jgi:hypothetical protein
VDNVGTRSIILTMVVSFSIALGIMLWQRKADERPPSVSEVNSTAPPKAPEMPAVSAQELPLPPTPAAQSSETAGRQPDIVPPQAADQDAQSNEAPSGALPVIFHIRHRRDSERFEWQVLNTTIKPLSLTVRDVNPSTQQISEMQITLAPSEKKIYSSDDGLDLHAGDRLILQSPPYEDQVARVP